MTESNFIPAPLSLSQAVFKSFRLWWENLGGVILFSLVSGVISILPSLLGLAMAGPTDVRFLTIAVLICVTLINIMISTVIYAKYVHAVHGQIISASQAMALGLVRLPTILLFSLIYFGIFVGPILLWIALANVFKSYGGSAELLGVVFIAVFLFLIMILFVYTVLVIPIIVFENLKAVQAFKRSFFLIQGGWWYTSVVISVPFLVAILGGTFFNMLLGKYGIILGQMLFMPLNVAFMTVLYEHHKYRIAADFTSVKTSKL